MPDTPSDRAVVEPIDGCPPEIGYALWTLQETRRRTLRYVDGISAEALDWQPVEQRHSVATLLYHIAVFEMDWLYTDILGRAEDDERMLPGMPAELHPHFPYPILLEDHSYTPVGGEPLAEHLDRLAASRQALLDVLTAMSVEEFRTLRPSGDEQV
ncbi:MAG: DinB family protein, partial [Acidimicrobiia bacterium]|nr:DinB family protein [Acidimicrobiia bacterium]